MQPASRADADSVSGIPPTIAIEQRTSRGGRKSTVATLTEVYPFLRLLFVKLGTQHCPDCELPIEPLSADAIAARIMKAHRSTAIALFAPLVSARKGIYNELAALGAQEGLRRAARGRQAACPPRSGRSWRATRRMTSSCRWAA